MTKNESIGEQPCSAQWEEIPNAETRKAIENARNGINLSKGFHSVAELMENLCADD